MRTLVLEEYQKTMASVCRHYGVEEVVMMHSNKEYCVDARATLVSLLVGKGLSEAELVELTGLTQQCINKLKNSVRFREKGWSFRETMKVIKKELDDRTE